MLLSHALSQIFLGGSTPEERIEQGKSIAIAIVPDTEVGRWRAQGHTVRRGCIVVDDKAHFAVHITGPKGFQDIHLTHTPDGLTGRVGTRTLNGSTPATAQELVKLIDQLVG